MMNLKSSVLFWIAIMAIIFSIGAGGWLHRVTGGRINMAEAILEITYMVFPYEEKVWTEDSDITLPCPR